MINNLLAISTVFFVGFLVGYVLPKSEIELQADANVKDALKIINGDNSRYIKADSAGREAN